MSDKGRRVFRMGHLMVDQSKRASLALLSKVEDGANDASDAFKG